MRKAIGMSILFHALVTLIVIQWVSFSQVSYVPRQVYDVTLVTPAVAAQPQQTVQASPPAVEPTPPAPQPVEDEKKDEEMPPPPDKPKSKKPAPKKKSESKAVPTTEIQKIAAPVDSTAGTGQTAAPATGSMSFDSGDFPFAHYISRMRQKIASTWQPPGGTLDEKTCRVYFRVHRDGSVSHVSVEETSGIFLFDQSCQRAVLQASPLPPLPREYTDDYLGVHFGFLYRETQ
jgi:TonB family protein